MKREHSKDFLFHIETEAQFDSLKPLLLHLRDNTKITFDIVVPSAISEDTIIAKEVYEGGARAILGSDFNVIRSIDGVILPNTVLKTRYKVFLSAYMYQWHYQNLNVKYRIMFPYASYYFNKPNWTIDRFINEDYFADALLSHAVGTKPVTDIFTKTHIVPSLKLMSFRKKSSKKTKPVLLFAPTYNEIDFAVNFLKNIDAIKEKYTLIMRGHQRTSRVEDNKNFLKKIYQAADKIYDVDDYSIVTPLQEADIVVSDNSAVIFDAIYCGVPVALFSQEPNSFHYRGINTIQSDLIKKGDILWTNDPKKILSIINKTMTAKILKRQKEMCSELFPDEKHVNPIGQWMEVLSIYLDDKLSYEYSLAKQYWIEHIFRQVKHNQIMLAEIDNLNLQIQDREARIYGEQNPGIKIAGRRFIKACLYKLRFMKRGV